MTPPGPSDPKSPPDESESVVGEFDDAPSVRIARTTHTDDTSAERLQELSLALEGAADVLARAQRLALVKDPNIPAVRERLETAFADVVAVRNDVRNALMRVLGQRPKKLPVL